MDKIMKDVGYTKKSKEVEWVYTPKNENEKEKILLPKNKGLLLNDNENDVIKKIKNSKLNPNARDFVPNIRKTPHNEKKMCNIQCPIYPTPMNMNIPYQYNDIRPYVVNEIPPRYNSYGNMIGCINHYETPQPYTGIYYPGYIDNNAIINTGNAFYGGIPPEAPPTRIEYGNIIPMENDMKYKGIKPDLPPPQNMINPNPNPNPNEIKFYRNDSVNSIENDYVMVDNNMVNSYEVNPNGMANGIYNNQENVKEEGEMEQQQEQQQEYQEVDDDIVEIKIEVNASRANMNQNTNELINNNTISPLKENINKNKIISDNINKKKDNEVLANSKIENVEQQKKKQPQNQDIKDDKKETPKKKSTEQKKEKEVVDQKKEKSSTVLKDNIKETQTKKSDNKKNNNSKIPASNVTSTTPESNDKKKLNEKRKQNSTEKVKPINSKENNNKNTTTTTTTTTTASTTTNNINNNVKEAKDKKKSKNIESTTTPKTNEQTNENNNSSSSETNEKKDMIKEKTEVKEENKKDEAPVAPVAKSWAALFTKESKANSSKVKVSKSGKPISSKPVAKNPNPAVEPANVDEKIKISFEQVPLKPRGLINNGNMCFMNAILQPLLYCPPFYNFIYSLKKTTINSITNKPSLIESMIMFIDEFKIVKKKELEIEEYGEAFLPEYVYNTLRRFNSTNTLKGRQEDAEEYLGFLLNGIHDEYISKYLKSSNQQQNGKSDSDVWMEVGPKKKAVITREAEVKESPINKIFGGRIRSILKCPGSKDSATIEPFLSLQLDITPNTVNTIEDALKNLTIPETLPDYNNSGVIVSATKQNVLDGLPNILLLHLKCFTFDNNITQKVQKQILFNTTLEIKSDLLSVVSKIHQPYKYNLFAVVYHHGKMAVGGHYTCAVKQCNNKWLNFDDTKISPITEADVTSQKKNQLPYLLLYMLEQKKN